MTNDNGKEIDIRIPSVGESIREAVLAQWLKRDGETVAKDEPLFVMETDKVAQEVRAEASGVLVILVSEGETVAVGAVVGKIRSAGSTGAAPETPVRIEKSPDKAAPSAAEPAASPRPATVIPAPPGDATGPQAPADDLYPSVRRLAAERGVDVSAVAGTGPEGRVTKGDVILWLEARKQAPTPEKPPDPAPAEVPAAAPSASPEPADGEERRPMSPIRKRIAERLLEARRNTAMLTTFNEIDMGRAMDLRAAYKEAFQKKHGVALGFMSFFVKATVEALREFPAINAFVDGDAILYHHHYHVGVAIGSGRGLVVPVLRHADRLGFADIEKGIASLADKVKNNRLELADLEGGTFTISNGGVYGSLLSTPILNTPQSGILGMHKIEKRPVVVNDEIVIRSMMYVALSYDHRIVDGREAVTFLRRIKECVENPERLLMEV